MLIWHFITLAITENLAYNVDEQTIEVIDQIFLIQPECRGTIVIIQPNQDDQFTQVFVTSWIENRELNPVTIIESDTISTREKSWGKEPVCQNAVVFHHRPAPSIFFDIQAHFYVNKVIMVSQYSKLEANTFLRSLSRENIFLLSKIPGKVLRLYHWRANNHVSQTVFQSVENKQLLEEIQLENTDASLSGRHLKVGSLDYPPYVWKSQEGSTHEGIEPSLIDIMSGHLNFTYEYVRASPNEMWGEILGQEGNYTFTGLMGMLVRKEADAICGLFYLSYLRWPFMGYTTVYKTNYESFLVPAPQPYAKWKALIFSFNPPTWIATIVSSFVIVIVLRLMSNWSVWKPVNQRSDVFRDMPFCALYVIGNLLNIQMQPQNIVSTPHRIFIIWWLFGTLILTTGYRSGLISYMTFPFTPPNIDTLQQLADSQLTKIVFSNFQKGILINSTSKVQKTLGEQLVPYYNMSEIFLLLGSNQYAVESNLDNLLYVAATMYPTKTTTGPKVHLIRDAIMPVQAAFGLQKESQLKPYFDRDIQRLVEVGIVDYQVKRFAKKIANWNPKKSNDRVSFSLDSLQGAFYLVAIGFILSLLVFIAENIFRPKKE